jgi:hypothetical protein
MKGWIFHCFLILILSAFPVVIDAQPVADWAYQEWYSPVDLIGKDEKPAGYRIVAPVTYPNDMVSLPTVNETGWNFNMGKAGEFVLIYIPSPGITRNDEFFQVHERDVSFIGEPFDENNLYYDGTVYSCWGNIGGTRTRYDCARFIDGHFFKLSSVFNTTDEALRYNQKLREIINTIKKSGN